MIEKVQLNLVEGFEDVRDVYRVCREGDCCWVEGEDGKELKGWDSRGYRQMCLQMISGKEKIFLQHRIFMICFVPNPENKPEINHLDSNKSNNRLSNLSWVTTKENVNYAYLVGENKDIGDNHHNSIIRSNDIPVIWNMHKNGFYQREIAERFGVNRIIIWDILHQRTWIKETKSYFLHNPHSLLIF